MSGQARLVRNCTVAVLVTAALTLWRFLSARPEMPPVGPASVAPLPVAALSPSPPSPDSAAPAQQAKIDPYPSGPPPSPAPWNEHTLTGTRWGRDGFEIEFGADRRLLIQGRERAKWRVQGRRVWLYQDATGEEHMLEIAGSKLLWEGHELALIFHAPPPL